MRLAYAAALVLVSLATPAHATGGMECRPIAGRGPIVAFGFPHSIAPQVFSASIEDGPLTLRTGGLVETSRLRSLTVGQSWIDRDGVRLDLVDPNVERFEGQLRVTFRRDGAAIGTFTRNGRSWRVRCEEA
jgi:hypothetical protein